MSIIYLIIHMVLSEKLAHEKLTCFLYRIMSLLQMDFIILLLLIVGAKL